MAKVQFYYKTSTAWGQMTSYTSGALYFVSDGQGSLEVYRAKGTTASDLEQLNKTDIAAINDILDTMGDAISALQQHQSEIMHIKGDFGTGLTQATLPATGCNPNDAWRCAVAGTYTVPTATDSSHTEKLEVGDLCVMIGDSTDVYWTVLQNNVDMSAYVPKSAVTSKGNSTTPVYFNASGEAVACDLSNTYAAKSHTHNYAGSASAGGAANSVKTNLTIKLNGGSTEETNLFTFNGSSAKTIDITPSAIGAAASSHTHNYAGSSSAGGAANSVKANITIKLNGGTTEGTNLFTYNGGTAKTIDITPSAIGAAASSHTHSYLPLTGGTLTGTLKIGADGPEISYDTTNHRLQINGALYNDGNLYVEDDIYEGLDKLSVKYAGKSHTHNYAGSASAGGAANSVKTNLTIKLNGGSTEDTNLFTFNGSSAKTIDITPSAIGAAASDHTHSTSIATSSGTSQITLTHGGKFAITAGGTSYIFTMPESGNTDRYVNSASFADDSTNNNVKMTLTRAGSDTATVTANIPKVSSSSAGVAPKGAAVSSQSQSTKFLREDGTWAAPSYTTNTNTASAVDNILDGSNSGTAITYAPYTAQQSKLSFDTSSTNPTRTDRLNLNGYLYATKLYSGGTEVSVSGHTHSYAGSASAGGAANSVKTNLIIKLNGGSTEGTNLFTFNGSTAKTIDITPSAIGAVATSDLEWKS